jgi:DNA-binding NtrC family response regulator
LRACSFAALTGFGYAAQTKLAAALEPAERAGIAHWDRENMAKPLTLVLVVEDELLVREDALDLFRRAGLEARGFSSATETLTFLREHARETAAVFTDMWLESATEGLDLASTINATWPWISLLVTSGATARPPTGLPLKAHYVAKPWRPEQVLRFMQKQVRSEGRSEAA